MRRLGGMSCGQGKEEQMCTSKDQLLILDLLPIEVTETIFSFLRPADLVAVAASSPYLEVVVRSRRLWRHMTVNVPGSDVALALRQIELAPQLKELNIGFDDLTAKVLDPIRQYVGAASQVQTLRLRVSTIGADLSTVLLERHGRTVKQLDVDLRHGHLEYPRCNIALLLMLPNLSELQDLTVRTDNMSDIIILSQLPVKLVSLDIHRMRVGEEFRGGPGPAVGAAAAHLISRHSLSLESLLLPPAFDANLCAVVSRCKSLKSLASNVWTLPALEHLHNLHTLSIYPPDQFLTHQDVAFLLSYSRRARKVLNNVKELRFLSNDIVYDVLDPLASASLAQAVMCLLLTMCKTIEVVQVRWIIEDDASRSNWTWMDSVLSHHANNLRELYIGGNKFTPRYLLSLARYCPNLEVLDVRMSPMKPSAELTDKVAIQYTTSDMAGMRRALALLREALPDLTLLFDDVLENAYDWNFYLDETVGEIGKYTRTCAFRNDTTEPPDTKDKLFIHLLPLDQWISKGGFVEPSKNDVQLWRCATLDSSLWNTHTLIDILNTAPALGLLDFRDSKSLFSGKRGKKWMTALASGPSEIRGIRLRTKLVAPKLWCLVRPTFEKIGKSIIFLELDFRGRPTRDWRDVLVALSDMPNLSELVLRGVFDDDVPVLDWLHGRLPSLIRLDLRDCRMATNVQMTAFVVSLEKLLHELSGTLRAIALPLIPRRRTTSVVETVNKLTDLQEVALHSYNLPTLRPMPSLRSLEVYADRNTNRTLTLCNRVVSGLRQCKDNFRMLESFTLTDDLFNDEQVQAAISDVLYNLSNLQILSYKRRLRTSVKGPRCKDIQLILR